MKLPALAGLRAIFDQQGDTPRVREAGRDTARSPMAESLSPDPEALEDKAGPRSPFLRRMDMKSRETKVLSRGPTDEAIRAGRIVDAANAARAAKRAQP